MTWVKDGWGNNKDKKIKNAIWVTNLFKGIIIIIPQLVCNILKNQDNFISPYLKTPFVA